MFESGEMRRTKAENGKEVKHVVNDSLEYDGVSDIPSYKFICHMYQKIIIKYISIDVYNLAALKRAKGEIE